MKICFITATSPPFVNVQRRATRWNRFRVLRVHVLYFYVVRFMITTLGSAAGAAALSSFISHTRGRGALVCCRLALTVCIMHEYIICAGWINTTHFIKVNFRLSHRVLPFPFSARRARRCVCGGGGRRLLPLLAPMPIAVLSWLHSRILAQTTTSKASQDGETFLGKEHSIKTRLEIIFSRF